VPPPATHTPAVITPAPITWDLAEDVVGMWDYEQDDGRYHFDFLSRDRVIVSYDGIQPYGGVSRDRGVWDYRIQDQRTLVIEQSGEEWPITVLGLSAHQLTLAGIVNEVDQFHRAPAIVNLESEMVGLWLYADGEYPAIEFTALGDTVGDFGRGTYEVVSGNSVLITCEEADACAEYLEVEQSEPLLAVRIFGAAEENLSLHVLGIEEPWDLERQAEQDNLEENIVGLWQDEDGLTVEFAEDDVWIDREGLEGSYEVLSNTTLWVVQDGWGQALVVAELTADQLSYYDWGYFDEEDLWVLERVDES
jgi:hypothetical protein